MYICEKMPRQKDGVGTGYQDRKSELLPRYNSSTDRVSIRIISLSRDGENVGGNNSDNVMPAKLSRYM